MRGTKIFLTIALLLSLFTVAKAQNFEGGLLAGVAGTQVSGDDLQGYDKAGIYAGGYVSWKLNERSAIQMELNFIQKGSQKTPDSTDWSQYLLRLSYIEIPIHYHFKLNKSFIAEGGLSYGVLVHQFEERDYSSFVATGDGFSNGDLSFNLGMLYQISDRWKVNLRYSHSLLPIRKHAGNVSNWWNHGQYNEVLSLLVHYRL